MRNGGAHAVCSIAPIVKGTFERFSDDGAAAEVCAQVSAARIHHGDLAARCPISRELPAQNALGEWLALYLAARAEEIPGGRIDREIFRRWGPG